MPKVSVIIPVYDAAAYIAETLDSVLQQTFADFEIITVNDGSRDNSEEIINKYVQNFPEKIKYVSQENQGPGAARNRGLKEAKGEYIAFLDSDDLWMPHRLEAGVKILLANPDVGMVHARSIRISDDKKPVPPAQRDIRYLSGNIFLPLLLRKAHVSCLTVLLRRTCFDKTGLFDEARVCIGVEDRDMWLRVAKHFKVAFLDQEVGYYRIRPTSISRNTDKMLQGKLHVINKVCLESGNVLAKHNAIGMVYKEFGDAFLIDRQFGEARKYYCRSLLAWPFSFWGWLNFIKSFLSLRKL